MIELEVKYDGRLNLDAPESLKRAVGLEKGGKIQKAIDSAVIRWNGKYTPKITGTLTNSAWLHTVIGSGTVIYQTPYAKYLYYGEVYGPNIPVYEHGSPEPTRYFSPPGKPKHPTGRQLEYNKDYNPLAGSHWFERMKADHAKDILREAMNVAGLS